MNTTDPLSTVREKILALSTADRRRLGDASGVSYRTIQRIAHISGGTWSPRYAAVEALRAALAQDLAEAA